MNKQDTKQLVQTKLSRYDHGLISLKEFWAALAEEQVRGEFKVEGGFIGYDYRNQQWIEG